MESSFLTKKRDEEHPSSEVTDDEAHAIRHGIEDLNQIRRQAGLPELDLDAHFARETLELRDRKFADLLTAHMQDSYRRIDGSPGLPGRIKQHLACVADAESSLRSDTGIATPGPAALDLAKFVRIYQSGKLHAGEAALTSKGRA